MNTLNISKNYIKCSYSGCQNKMAQNPNVSYFSLPRDPTNRVKWIENCGITILVESIKKSLKVWGEHFEQKMFLNDLQNRLHSHAIPRHFINDTPSSSSSISRKLDFCSTVDDNISNAPAECETTFVSSPNVLDVPLDSRTPSNLLLTKNIISHNTINSPYTDHSYVSLDSESNYSFETNEPGKNSSSVAVQTLKSWSDDTPRKQSLKSNLLTIVKSHIRCQKKRPNGYRYSDELKQFALTIYFLGPAVYRFFRPTLCLPVPRTLRRVMSKYELNPGLNDFLFELELIFRISNFKLEALDGTLCADEMALKTHLFYSLRKDEIIGFHQTNSTKTYDPAKFAFVLMICGINVQWKQPIAYFLVSGSCTGNNLYNIIMSTIAKLQNISLDVKAFITDQGSNFQKFSKKVFVSPSRPYFYVNEQKVIYMFDPPHLLKSTRNMFFKHNFINTPKLTHAHIYPGPFEKMRVYLAAKVFSHTVAATMQTNQSLGKLSFDSLQTIQCIEKMDNLFDIFNSSKTPNSKDFRRPFKNTSNQREYLLMMVSFFENLRVVTKNNGSDVTNRMNFINGWLISINGLLLLWSNMNPTNDCNFVLYTSRLNTDRLENLFGMFRLQNENNLNPTPVQFYCAFKKLFCLNYFKHSPNANCLKDLDSILSHLNVEENGNYNTSTANPINFIPYLKIEDVDYRDLNILESNALNYICGYLYMKCLKKHTCDECIKYGHSQKDLDKSFLFCHFKAYEDKNKTIFGHLQAPHNDFHNFIFELENIFIEQFPILAVDKNVGIKMKDAFFNVPFNHPCPYFDHAFLVKLYGYEKPFSPPSFYTIFNEEILSDISPPSQTSCTEENDGPYEPLYNTYTDENDGPYGPHFLTSPLNGL
ncbi:hypothetical protein AGLY_015866 [Aphis glycines]|uniref:THAP-type domain-containing protein n=1 Tax=Aphis glycines TaxID=307491 RepID=A0A6G0T050_APHGL|nr:hypothetical protein AGLY_015866 [Aphis glycines]